MSREFKTLAFKADSFDEEQGIFAGYAAVFGNVDSGGDVIEPGAFKKSLDGGFDRVKILSGHNDGLPPIGKPVEMKEDDNGLYIRAAISDTAMGRDIKTLLRDGVLNELSIGYDPVIFDYDSETGIRHLREVKLWEVSVVTWAMNPEALITDYKGQKTKIGGRNTMAKTIKVTSEETKRKLKNAIKEAITDDADEKNAEEEAFKGQKGDSADLVGIIEDALEAVNEKRKSRKEAGEELEDITPSEIIEAVTEIMGDTDVEDEEVKEDEEATDEEEKRKSAGRTSARQTKQSTKRKGSTVQRKYGDIYFQLGGEEKSSSSSRGKKSISPSVQLARAIKCLDVFGKHDPEAAAYYATKHYDDSEMSREFKALNATNPSAGGYLIPEVYLDQIIEMLYAKTVVFELGARKVPMPNGNLNIPKMTAGARATWGGEQRKISKTQPAFGSLKLFSKRLEAIVSQSRELMMSTNYSADQMFADDLTRRMQLGLDYGALYGTGNEYQPLGIASNKEIEIVDVTKLSDPLLTDVDGRITPDFPVFIRSKVLAKNVDDINLGWAFNSIFEGYLMNMKTTTGAYIYRDEMNQGKLLGFQYQISNQIPTDGTGATELFFGNWSDLLIGEQLGLETYTTLDGSWTDDAGVQHNAFEENLAGTRALMYVDVGVRHAESFICVKKAKAI